MDEQVAPTLDDLIDQIATWPAGMPVRAMERVLAAGENALPALVAALDLWQDDEERDLLWLVVLLGELRQPGAIEPLINQMRRTHVDMLALASAEALAKIGPPAVPALIDLVTAPDHLLRLYAYACLGWIRADRAYAALVEALGPDRELGDVLAMALGDQGRYEAIPLLYQAYQVCEPWQRVEFEGALRDLHSGKRDGPPWTRNWRLRYRRMPVLGGFEPGWVGIAALVRRNAERMAQRPAGPVRPLEEIVREPAETADSGGTCEQCGAPLENLTGLPVCPETAVSTAVYQLSFLKAAREDDLEDLYDLLDELDDQEWQLYDRGEPVMPSARRRWRDEVEEVKVCRATCYWLIEQGVEQVGPANALLLAKAARLADRYGDPEGLLAPLRPPAARALKVGRNDPCPCGSGRKYKRCCLGKA